METRQKKNILISFHSISSIKLKKKQIKEICFLKDKEWKYGIKSQLIWFDKNIKKNDIHNLFYLKAKLIGDEFINIFLIFFLVCLYLFGHHHMNLQL